MIWNSLKTAFLGTLFVVGMFVYTIFVINGTFNLVYAFTADGFISAVSATVIFFFFTFFIGAIIDYYNDRKYRCG